jgi:methylmalonyl-CoA/ethylmalonyl-CoA epimerase
MSESPITGLNHVAVLVRDIDASLSYYTDRLGLKVLSDERLDAVGVRLVFLDAGNAKLQVVAPIADGPIADHLRDHGEGLHHICLEVDDIEGAVQELAPGQEVAINRAGDRLSCFLPDRPNSILVELLQYEK